jgi:hypothetical protein
MIDRAPRVGDLRDATPAIIGDPPIQEAGHP